MEEPKKEIVNVSGDRVVSFWLSSKNYDRIKEEVSVVSYIDRGSDGTYDEIFLRTYFTEARAGSIDLINMRAGEYIGVSNPFDYELWGWSKFDGEEKRVRDVSRKNLYENNLVNRLSSDKDLQNFIFDDRIKAIRNAFEAYRDEGRVKPTYEILYKEFQTWQVNLSPNGSLRSIETGTPELLNQEAIYPVYKD